MSYPLTNLPPGDMQLYDNSLPGLPAGDYEIQVTQAMPNMVTNQFSQTVNQEFRVDAPQFSINASEVHSMFPGDQSNGDFSLNLPYVVFETPALPWERLIDSGKPDTIPWMALLVLSSSEVSVEPLKSSPLLNTTVQDFLKPDPKIVKPGILPSSLSPETLQSQMNSVLLSTDTFTLMSPRIQELANLAHVRQVNPSSQAVSGKTTDAWFSELIANRFPVSVNPTDTSGMKNYALVVSLEGLSQYLVDTPGWPPGADHIQLAVLSAWSFISAVQPGQTFAELAENLSSQAVAPGSDNTLLRIPITDNGSVASQRILEGYTALSFHTAPGDETFSWYRGPFTPYPAQPLPAPPMHYVHPSQVLIYDQANAIFDTSYSAAWTIGRLSALANPVFTDSVQLLRKRILNLNAKLLQRSSMPHLASITDLATLSSSGLTRKIFAEKMAAGMGNELMASFAIKPDASLPVKKTRAVNYLYPDDVMPDSPSAQAKWFMQKPEISKYLMEDSSGDMESLGDWLAQLVLLKNIPFTNMVPDQRMLPQESIRFFNIDPGWLKTLFDGAVSIGVHSSKQELVHSMIAPHVWNFTLAKATKARRKLLMQEMDDTPPIGQLPAAGMLLRSALVSGWPGLQVNATVGGNPINIMRMDHLSPTVLIVLWDLVPDTVSISQPQQGFAYGVADGWMIPMRSLNASNLGAATGTNFPLSGTITQFMRPGNNGQNSNVLKLVPAIATQPGYFIPALAGALAAGTLLTPSQLAIELIRSPEEIKFNPTVRSSSNTNSDGNQ